MGTMNMLLIEAIENLDALDPESTVFAAEPWSKESAVLISHDSHEGGFPEEAEERGLRYFLEVFLIQEFLKDWLANLAENPSSEEKCERIIQYAINDA